MGSLVAELAEKLSSATNNFDIDEQTLYVNTSADTVGIGTNSPDGKLSVHQSGTDDIFNLYDGTTNILTVADGGTLTHKGTLLVGVDDTGHDVKFFGATSGKYMLWDESADSLIVDGKVGIGTNSPGSILETSQDVAGNAVGIRVINTNDADGDSVSLDFGLARDGGLVFGNGGQIIVGKENDWTGTASTIDSYMAFHTILNESNSEAMRIDSSGKVGIGTTSPSTTLDVDGEITVKSKIQAFTGTSLTLQSPSGNAVIINTNGANEKVRITSDGKVGIGVSSPISPLHIGISATDSIPTNTLAQQGDNNVLVLRNESNSANYSGLKLETRTTGASAWLIANEWKNTYLGDLVFRGRSDGNNSSERMRITSAGTVTIDNNVGIGTTSPVGDFQIGSNGIMTHFFSGTISASGSVTHTMTQNSTGGPYYGAFMYTGIIFFQGWSNGATNNGNKSEVLPFAIAQTSFSIGSAIASATAGSYGGHSISTATTNGNPALAISNNSGSYALEYKLTWMFATQGYTPSSWA